jgi:fluoroquinolone resistance protein
MNRSARAACTQAKLEGCVAARAIADASIGAAIIWPEQAIRLTVTSTDFVEVDFRGGNLGDSRFVDCAFLLCNLRGCDLSECAFERCTFYERDSQAGCDFSYAALRNSRFEACDLTTAACTRTRAFGVEFRKCQAAGIDFSHADFSIGATRFVAAAFTDCNLAYADFSHTDLSAASLAGSRLSHSVWHNASLRDANLAGCDLDNIDAHGLVLAGADLRDARFNGLDPRRIDLTGVRMHVEQGLEVLRTLGLEID